ncbi:MAG: DksA/TraR family C4-type zinc finger protein [Desulfobacter sp.]|nr:DksA/TraR family C4-type zinc finger protein [Desulfobacter sp.]WDP84033.1 MAG: DksA/TraR family C4-type zinc finger protein [Desulfobacter sp.]
MAVGWARDGAVQEQIDAGIDDGVKLARSRLPKGKSLTHCALCEEKIPRARQKAVPGVRLCVTCQAELETRQEKQGGINRKGSKDSQLK